MTLAVYIKELPKIAVTSQKTNFQRPKNHDRLFFTFVSLIGLATMIFAVYPAITWQLTTASKFKPQSQTAPIPKGQVLSQKSILTNNVQIVKDPDGFSYFTTNYKPNVPRPAEFFMTIPKLRIENAKTKVDSVQFSTSLAHFPTTAIPGEVGNAFITGHSVLPQFADPQDYKAIFTELSDLEIGDDVYVKIGEQQLHFIVQYSKIVDPHDSSPLLPISQSGRNLTLMTCVPPGTNLKRLIVITSLI